MTATTGDLTRFRRGVVGMAQRANPAFAVGAVVVPLVALVAGVLGLQQDPRGLLFVHVMAGVLWTGIDVFMGVALGPILGGLDPEERASFFTRFTPKMTFLMPTLATVTIVGGIVMADFLGKFPHMMPWLALMTAATTVPIVLLIGYQFDALTDRRTLAVLAVALVGSGLFLADTVGQFAMTSPWIATALVIVTLLTIGGFGLILPGEVRIYRQITSENPDLDLIGDIGMRNAKLGGIQGALQLAIIFVMVGIRWM